MIYVYSLMVMLGAVLLVYAFTPIRKNSWTEHEGRKR